MTRTKPRTRTRRTRRESIWIRKHRSTIDAIKNVTGFEGNALEGTKWM